MSIPPVLETIFGNLSDGVCVSDGGRVIYLNAAAERMLGSRALGEETRTICDLLCAHLVVSGSSECASSCPLRDPADPRLEVTFRGRHERPPSFQWRDDDIRRVAESRALRVRCLRLPGTGRQDAEGLHLTLIEDASAENELERRKEDWRSMVVHDLRAPLSNVFAALRTLQEDAPGGGAPDAETLDIALRSCRRVMGMLETYLELARMDAGQMPVELGAAPLDAAVRRVLEELSYVARERGVSVEVELPEGLGALADAGLLERVLQNLLHNALKFSPDGGRVRVSGEAVEPARAALSVRNDGPPLSAEDLPRIFQRFGRVAPGRPGRGAGLGLAFCREALKLMGGEISVACGPETGTTFTVVLPRAGAER